jgi:hypothetical protein
MSLELCAMCSKRNNDLKGRVAYVPKGCCRGVDPDEIKALRNSGLTIMKIAQRKKLTQRRIYQILRDQQQFSGN